VKENGAEPYYTNSSQLPVGYTSDIFEALELQDNLQTKYTGGTVVHVFLGERLPSAESCRQLVKKIAYKFHLPYFTITPTFSICPVHGYIKGEHYTCPIEINKSLDSARDKEVKENATESQFARDRELQYAH